MKQKLLLIILILSAHMVSASQNGTRPDYDNVIVGSSVLKTISVLTNDNAVAGKNYQLISVFYSATSPSPGITINTSGNNVTYRDNQSSNLSADTFFYVVKDLNSNTNDTNFVLITKVNLPLDLYPGDANKDNICNHIDVLSIGIAYGKTQIQREGIYFNNNWGPVRAYDWSLASSKSNHKHADANGDGTVDSAGDVTTIRKNYASVIGTANIAYSPAGGETFQMITVDTLRVASPSSIFQFKVNLGSTASKVSNAYGIAFTVKGDTALLKSNKLNFKSSKWFADQENTLDFYKVNEQTGEVEIAIVRKSGKNNSGLDELGVIDVVVEEELGGLAGGKNFNFEILKAVLIDSNYNLLPVSLPSPKPVHFVKKSTSSVTNSTNTRALNFYLNNESLVLENKKSTSMDISIFNILGRQMYQGRMSAYQTQEIDTNTWTQGVYFIKTNTEAYKIIVK